MNERDLFRAIGNVDDDLIEESNRTPRRFPLRMYLSTAAAACLCIVVMLFAARIIPDGAKEAGEPRAALSSTESQRSANGNAPSGDRAEGVGPAEPESPPSPTGASPTQYGAQDYRASEAPQDFSFRLSWEGKSYSSATQLYSDGQDKTLALTSQELETVWELIGQAGDTQSQEENPVVLTYTANGSQYTLELSRSDARQLITLLEEAVQRIR